MGVMEPTFCQCWNCKNMAGILHVKFPQDSGHYELPVCKLEGGIIDTSKGCTRFEAKEETPWNQ